jgi:C4-dicarboxylate transporter, DctM subunit
VTVDGVLLLTLGIFFVFALLEVPIGVALIVAGFAGIVMLKGSDLGLDVLASVPFASTSSYALFAIPAFILLGAVVSNSGIARHMFLLAGRATSRVPNGVAVTTVGATTLMSGISGSSAADVASMGKMCAREMTRVGYSLPQSAAIVAAASAFAALIPPSIGLVLYGIIGGVSVGQMLLAGIIPGLLSAGTLMTYLMIRGRDKAGSSATELAEHVAAEQQGDVVDVRRGQVTGVLIAVVLFTVVLGGLYAGFLTATEAAGVGAFTAVLLVAVLPRARDKKLGTVVWTSLAETVTTSGMIFLLVIGGSTVTYLVVSTSLAERIAAAVLALPVSPTAVLALFLIALIPMGMILDGLSILLLTVPIVAPVVVELGFSPIWFGILFMKMVEIGLLTPPVGINVYVVAGMFKGLAVGSVFKAVTPFVLLDLALVVVLFLNPGIVTWLPSSAG